MTGNAPYKTLRLGKSGKVALVDADDYARLRSFSWCMSKGHVCRKTFPKPYGSVRLSHDLLGLPPRVRVRFVNGNPLDCRRANLQLQPYRGNVVELKRAGRKRFRAHVSVDGFQLNLGYWPTRRTAELATRIANEAAERLRGRGLTRKQIQRQLDMATGRRTRSRYVPIKVQQAEARAA